MILYHKDYIKVDRRQNLELPGLECIWVEIRAKPQQTLLNISYRSPQFTDRNYWSLFNPSIGLAYDLSPNLLIVGDLSIEVVSRTPFYVNDVLSVNGLANVIHFTANSLSSIDPILVSDTIRIIEYGTIPIDGVISDHDCKYIEIDYRFKLNKCFKRSVWDYKHGDYERFRQQVSDTDWDSIINDDDTTNNVCINFTDKFLTIAKECIPLKTILVRHNDKSWISSELKKEIRKRDRL